MDRPHGFEVEVVGDLSGRGVWTLTSDGGAVHIRFDWRVIADRALLRYLTPVLRPLFRWNHNWSIERAREGLEPYARERAEGVAGTAGSGFREAGSKADAAGTGSRAAPDRSETG